MAEYLSPILTRQQYVSQYMDNLRKEQANIDYNYQANQTYDATGETVMQASTTSPTIGFQNQEQAKQLLQMKLRPYVFPLGDFVRSLPQQLLQFLSVSFEPFIKRLETQVVQFPLSPSEFRTHLDLFYNTGMLLQQNQPANQPANNQPNNNQQGVFQQVRNAFGFGLPRKKQSCTGRGAYGALGKYMVNLSDLDNGILTLKTQSGNSVANFPKKMIGTGMSRSIKEVVNNKNPRIEDVEEMGDDEVEFVNMLAKKAQSNELKIPSRKKSEDEQKLQRFEILKGQIIAGNDNEKVIKEFKTLLLQFKNNGKLPARQVQEILLDLAGLGY